MLLHLLCMLKGYKCQTTVLFSFFCFLGPVYRAEITISSDEEDFDSVEKKSRLKRLSRPGLGRGTGTKTSKPGRVPGSTGITVELCLCQ